MITLHRYEALKILTVLLGAVTIPLGTYAGICFGQERWLRGGVLVCGEVSLYIIDTFIYFRVMEQMNGKH
jgi:hypothetical protein